MTEIGSIYNGWMEILILIWIKHQTNNQNIVKIPKQFYFLNYEFDKINSFNSKLCLLVSNPSDTVGKEKSSAKISKRSEKILFPQLLQ